MSDDLNNEDAFFRRLRQHKNLHDNYKAAHQWMMFLTLVFLLGGFAINMSEFWIVAALFFSCDVAFEFRTQAYRHGEIRRRLLELQAKTKDFNSNEFVASCTKIISDECDVKQQNRLKSFLSDPF